MLKYDARYKQLQQFSNSSSHLMILLSKKAHLFRPRRSTVLKVVLFSLHSQRCQWRTANLTFIHAEFQFIVTVHDLASYEVVSLTYY